MSLISDTEMEALRDLVLSGMETTVYVYNRTTTQTADGQETSYPASPSSTVIGWLYEITPNATAMSVINGGEDLSELFRLYVPIETVINSGDKVVIGVGTYYVQHTNADNTYRTSMSVALRNLV
jgi:hypothetical protein